MKIRRYSNRGELLFRGYGVAWLDPCLERAVCYPFPFHKPIGWLRRWYWDVIQPPRSPECDRLKRRVVILENRVRIYREREVRDEAWARDLVRTCRRVGDFD